MGPQKENGYTPIANELLDAIVSFRIPGELRQVFDAIIRKTYGFNKKEDYIANSQIMEMTGIGKQNVYRSLLRLVEHKLVIKSDYSLKRGIKYRINKDYKEWIPFSVVKVDDKKKSSQKRLRPSSELITKVVKTDYETSSELTDTKDKIHSKDNIQKKEGAPAILAKTFFKGVQDLREAMKDKKPVESKEGIITAKFLKELQSKYPDAAKDIIWREINRFERYWTEKNATGTKELWQMKKTFEIDRRLVTWFGKVNSINNGGNSKDVQEILL